MKPQAGYFVQPQNFDPVFECRSAIGAPHRSQIGSPFSFACASRSSSVRPRIPSISEFCSEAIGHSIGREILNQRLARAKHLLKDRTIPLNAIARTCGFCNASYFTNTFRRETGLTPKNWRKHASIA